MKNKKASVGELKSLVANGGVKPANAGSANSGAGGGYGESRIENLFVPMASVGTLKPEGMPTHSMDVSSRGELLKDWLGSDLRDGKYGAIYRSLFWAIVCLVLTVITLTISVYVAAVFAYLTGHFWSERLLNDAWSLEWYKGKAMYYTV